MVVKIRKNQENPGAAKSVKRERGDGRGGDERKEKKKTRKEQENYQEKNKPDATTKAFLRHAESTSTYFFFSLDFRSSTIVLLPKFRYMYHTTATETEIFSLDFFSCPFLFSDNGGTESMYVFLGFIFQKAPMIFADMVHGPHSPPYAGQVSWIASLGMSL